MILTHNGDAYLLPPLAAKEYVHRGESDELTGQRDGNV